MKKILAVWLLSLIFTFCKNESASPPAENDPAPTRFTAMNAAETGISFVNRVEDGEQFNILSYRNFYNGGGVAIGDVNNDGQNDIYFTANLTKNSLYLNRGKWKFEDVTAQSGTGGTRSWSTGVSMADINGDGWLDIYVCNSGDVAGGNKENELFINNGDAPRNQGIPTFTESAAAYGLNDAGFGTHAAYFDADGDGDLDCYLLNNSFKNPGKIDLYKKTRAERDPLGGDKLLLNNLMNPASAGKKAGALTFTDRSEPSGIYGSPIGFGLGVSVSDLNGDMLPDIYISNDFWERDYLYFNLGGGRFEEKLSSNTGHCSVSSMGADIGDLDNDGDPEIFTTDMLAADNYRLKTMTVFDEFHLEDAKYRADFHYQILQNCLQLNDGTGNFTEIAHQAGVAATDWSWGALLFDFDNDGWKDIFVANGIYRDIMYLDFTTFINDKEEVRKKVSETGRYDWREFARHIPSNKLANYAFVNRGGLKFKNQATALGLGEPSHSNGAAYGDLDNDGDLDLVVNNVNMPAFLYRNETTERGGHSFLKVKFEGTSGNRFGVGARVDILSGGTWQQGQNFPARGFESSGPPELLFGLGTAQRVDTLRVIWPDRAMQVLTNLPANQTLTLRHAEAGGHFVPPKATPVSGWFQNRSAQVLPTGPVLHHENRFNDFNNELLLPKMLSTEGPALAQGDLNGDGLADFVVGGGPGDPDRVFIQKSDGRFAPMRQPALEADSAFETTCLALFDADGDRDLDLLAGSGGNEPRPISAYLLRYYENDGQGNLSWQKEKTPPAAGNLSCIVPGDFDGDGDPDLFIGARCVPGLYGVPPTSFLFRNEGGGRWTDLTTREMAAAGMVTAAAWLDLDSDRDLDLLVAGDWMPLAAFRNEGGRFSPRLLPVVDSANKTLPTEGWWTALQADDLDGDGDPDLILGNWGLNSKFKASPGRPLTLYVNDFDKNGKPEFIFNWFPGAGDRAYPFASKPDLTAQMPFLKKKILRFEDYAHMTYEDLFSPAQREKALPYRCSILASAVVWNEGNGHWRLEPLPDEAQRFPVFAIVPGDFDGDGQKDLFLGGNFFGLKPEAGHLDAGPGLVLKGAGQHRFLALSPAQSGLAIRGEIRDALLLSKRGNRQVLLVGRNNDGLLVLETR